ncbi:deoxyribodipyrimidine photo-lyase [Rhizobium leguminosarum]|uniref:cryptochrome/photolyase family protein n=1 Tax=Rhizobium leguminosarum TaxID=384 RepID=UPI001031D41C|nr:deoxyribodipyrimidine photo-lyase [Rhizobium leguminosarum]NKK40664.1 deoxyribodipyrimidine photo-lyase [Rhizobium leguminosarum bv. viciae]QIO71685.1 deoxyribodipyrimidine photo-lyase [Rhizobium leguminosarum bv. trifolii]QIO78703.1 deoxyribodipyrimidine photo-lyase [Rhizobium leguminosarum bv. trifolii]TAU20504.1 deoxyribodipyrimidine photo-lyase [Rhizobium leguminosarum]TAU40507.1 deoxyribodipyrimidine photo-lyase [Rhizobium leguminosarum]
MAKDAAKPVILWFRKDLRLDDNRALDAAHRSGRPIIPLYISEPEAAGTGPLGAAQAWWLHHSLEALDRSLRKRQGRLVLASGEALEVLRAFSRESGAEAVFWNQRYDPAGISIDVRIKHELEKQAIEARSFGGQLLHEPSRLVTGNGTPYRVYTPFWRALEGGGEPEPPLEAPAKLRLASQLPKSEALEGWKLLPTKPDWAGDFTDLWTPGEEGAHEKLRAFIEDALDGYKENRDYPARPATSMLSPHLAFGEISPARIWAATRGLSKRVAAADVVHFRKEIAWREFSYHLLFHFPRLASNNWNERFDGFEWRNDEDDFRAWRRGMTGYPIIDAGMRQLWRHGWMHNRVRMIVASFLIKDLMIDWRRGEAWFRDMLVDADPANNAASWQWVAGSGADASPFFRIFNPVLQGEKFDPDGNYVRSYVPELRELGAKYIHRPFEAPRSMLDEAGIALGQTYPKPIVDHALARNRALAAYNATRDAA